MKGDVLDMIELAYRVDLPATAWLRELADTFYRHVGTSTGLYACDYKIHDGARMQVGNDVRIDMPDEQTLPVRASMEMMPIDFLRQTFARTDCATQSQHVPEPLRPFIEAAMAPMAAYGWYDLLAFSGVDPAGHGVYMGAWLPARERLSPRLRRRWTRAAVHVAGALRLRRRLEASERRDPDQAEAVLTPAGKVEHAADEAQLREAQSSLRAAVRDVERARGALRRRDPDAAVASWKGLVATRWSLVDHFESDGKRYVLAHRNEVPLSGFAALTARERQAVGFAALGHGNKLIAYELGVAPSTVAVLLHRAARKLGVSSRAELIAAYQKLAGGGA